MGTWGSGNLDSDGALDEVATRSARLMKQTWRRLRSRTSWEADEHAYDALFVDLETVLALDAAGLLSSAEIPDAAALDATIQRWLVGWDAYFDGLDPVGGFKAERRAVIEATFDRFKAVCHKHRM